MKAACLSRIRGILFDKDGTLVDFNRTWFGITMELAQKAADGDEARARALIEAGGYDIGNGKVPRRFGRRCRNHP